MKSDGIAVERPFVGRVVERLVCLMEVFDQAVQDRNKEAATFMLEEISNMTREGHKAVGKQHADFVGQAFLLQPYTFRALYWMSPDRPGEPNWGAVISYKIVMKGIITDLHKKTLEEDYNAPAVAP